MKTPIKYLCGILLLLVCSVRVVAGPDMDKVRKMYEVEKEYINGILASGKAYSAKYTIVSEVLNEKTNTYQLVTAEENVMAAKNMRYVKSKDTEVFMDDKDLFSIDYASNVIMRIVSTLNSPNINNEILFVGKVQDSMLKLLKVVKISKQLANKVNVIKYELVPVEPQKSLYAKVEFYVDESTGLMMKVHIEANTKLKPDTKSYTVAIMDRKTVEVNPEWRNLRKKFLNANGTLKAPYNKYHLEDLTKG